MFQEDYFRLESGWFTGRRVLDAGCGDTAKGAIRYHQFGAREVQWTTCSATPVRRMT